MIPVNTETLAQHWANIRASWANPTFETISKGYESAQTIKQCAESWEACDGVVAYVHALYYAGTLERLEGPAGQQPGWWNTV